MTDSYFEQTLNTEESQQSKAEPSYRHDIYA